MSYDYDLGGYSRPVTTASPDAQAWFDRGLAWMYGYHHEEAITCFRRAIEADPECAMAWWGDRVLGRTQLQQTLGGLRRG